MKSIPLIILAMVVALPVHAQDREYQPLPENILTQEKVKSKIGTLSIPNGYPTEETAQKLRDELFYIHAVQTYLNTLAPVSVWKIHQGLQEAGVKENEFITFPNMMDGKHLFLTANMDTYYYIGFINLKNGPVIVETPPEALGVIDDLWFRWVSDFGLPGSDRGEGGRYLIVPQGYDGPLPDGGFFIRYAQTDHVIVLGRSFLHENSPAKAIKEAQDNLAAYPYVPGGQGTSVGDYLNGNAQLGPLSKRVPATLVDGTDIPLNTVPPVNYEHFVLLDELIQADRVEALDPEVGGLCAAIGIKKGQEFNPTKREKELLTKAVEVANAYARTGGTGSIPGRGYRYYGEESGWWNPLFAGGYSWKQAPPEVMEDGTLEHYPDTGAFDLEARSTFFYMATGITPAMCMRLTGIGSQYLMNNTDSEGRPYDGGKTYRVTLPKGVPAERFWSLTVYDMDSRSIIQTDQQYPRVGSQSFPSPAAQPNNDGSYTIYFGPEQPADALDGNWIQTKPDAGWFQILRCYSPTEGFFDKSWRIGEVELVK